MFRGNGFKKPRMKGRLLLGLLFVAVSLFCGCATGSRYWQTEPPLAEGKGRIWFYRTAKFWGGGNQPVMHVGSAVAGNFEPGKAFYVDVQPGDYVLECSGMGWAKCNLNLAAGETKYVRLSLSFWAGFEPIGLKQFVMKPVDSDAGLAGLKRCKLRT
jgi:hypothetical protein